MTLRASAQRLIGATEDDPGASRPDTVSRMDFRCANKVDHTWKIAQKFLTNARTKNVSGQVKE